MGTNRRSFLIHSLAAVGSAAAPSLVGDLAEAAELPDSLVAKPPEGFKPLTKAGFVSRAVASAAPETLMQKNRLWPRPEPAREMLEAALAKLTGEPTITRAIAKFVHPSEKVAVKVNGIAGTTMATNFEVLLPIVEALLELGVPPERITVYEQYMNFLSGTRIGLKSWKLPAGVITRVHNNQSASMKPLKVCPGIPTRYVSPLTESTAVISVSLIKDHSICGYTGGLKNMTHGSIVNPHDHHRHQANPQIATLYAHPILSSRVRLHITDGFKLIYDGGPLDKNPARRILHGSVHASTDVVALDVIGAEIIDKERVAHRLPTLEQAKRPPKYIASAGELGLGVADRSRIQLVEVTV